MKAVVVSRPGPPEVLELREVADPEPAPDEVRVRVRATALNRADLLQRRGLYPAPPGAPRDIPGLEFAGEVELRGARARALEIGDRVMGVVGGGGHAEKVCVHERLCLALPRGLDWAEAAAIPEAFLTAHDALHERLGIRPGEVVLVHAAGSGVGTAAVQLARAAGARVVALSRTQSKRRALAALGAEWALDPADPQLPERIREIGGIDAVIDLVGAAAWRLNVDALRTGGRMVLLGLLGGARTEVDLARILEKRLTISATMLRSRPVEEKIALASALARLLGPLLEAGTVRPVIDRRFRLEEVAAAHAYMERNANFGKIVLTVGAGA